MPEGAATPEPQGWWGPLSHSRVMTLIFLGAIGFLTLVRYAILLATPLELGPDEAQYWAWSLRPDWGYYTKPPMIAWMIAATTSVCGDGEACVRAAAPLFHALTAILSFLIAQRLYGLRTGLLAGAVMATLPATSLSSVLITTDVALLFYWALALYAFIRLAESPHWAWACLLGLSLGLGLLSKYAMAYALIGIAVGWRAKGMGWGSLLRKEWLIVLGLMLAIIAPNLIWNWTHGFATVRHTAANANWGGDLFSLRKFIDFIASQFGVFGPMTLALLLAGIAGRSWRRGDDAQRRADLVLLGFILPVLIVVTAQAFISRANANWAAPAFVASAILIAGWAGRVYDARWLYGAIVVNAVLGALLSAAIVSPAVVSALRQDNAAKRLRGWTETGQAIIAKADPKTYRAILTDDREDIASLSYYTRTRRLPLKIIVPDTGPAHEFHLSDPLEPMEVGRVLYVTRRSEPLDVLTRFGGSTALGPWTIALGGGKLRTFYLYALEAPFRPSFALAAR